MPKSSRLNKLRKLKYAFSFKYDLPKHVLRKYMYTKVSLHNRAKHLLRQKLTKYPTARFMKTQTAFNDEMLADSFFLTQPLINKMLNSHPDPDSYTFDRFYFRFNDHTYKPASTIYTHRFKPGYMRY